MKKGERFFPVFFIFLFLSLVFWGLSNLGVFSGVRLILERLTSPLQGAKYSLFQKIPSFFEDPRVKKLTQENVTLRSKIIDRKRLEQENAALLDQFKTTTPTSYSLLPAQIIGTPDFIPGVSPSSFILNKGTKDGIKVGYGVVFKDNLAGKITRASFYLSKVDLINNFSSSFAAKTEKGVLGVIKGDSEKMILEHVILSQTLSISDTVLTYGDLNIEGAGYPASLIVGKIVSVDKNPSSLFQKAEVESILDFSKLTTVFVIMRP